MRKPSYVAFYNVVSTNNGSHFLAVGWCNEAGHKPSFELDKEKRYVFTLVNETGGPAAQVITPFSLSAQLENPPRSIHVFDDYGKHHVQVNGLTPVKDSENEAGKWVMGGMNA